MHPIVKLIIGIVLGLILSFCVIVLFESWMMALHPLKIANPSNSDYIETMKTMPISAFLIMIVGYALASFFGGYLAARISPEEFKLWAALTVGFLLLLGGIMNFVSIPHPWWVITISCISFMLFSFLAGKIAKR